MRYANRPISGTGLLRYNPRIVSSKFLRNFLRTRRGIAAAMLLGLLLVGMQLESQRHAIGHVGEWMQQPHTAGLQLPADQDACAICALFAGGANAAPAASAAAAAPVEDFVAPRAHTFTAPTAESPSPYHSRAPPSLL